MPRKKKENIPHLRQHLAILLYKNGPCRVGFLDGDAYQFGFTFEALEEAARGLGINLDGGTWCLPDKVAVITPRNYRPYQWFVRSGLHDHHHQIDHGPGACRVAGKKS